MELSHVIRLLFALVNTLVLFLSKPGCAVYTSAPFRKVLQHGSHRLELFKTRQNYFPRTCAECASICASHRDANPICKAFQCHVHSSKPVECDFYTKGDAFHLFDNAEMYVFQVNNEFHVITLGHRRFSIYKSYQAKKFLEARAHCNSLGGYLLQFDSQDEYDAVRMVIGGEYNGGFVGLNDLDTEGVWVTDRDNRTLDTSVWRWDTQSGQPNIDINENCGRVAYATGKIKDKDCNSTYRFLCERDV